jgi:hypothetical protein
MLGITLFAGGIELRYHQINALVLTLFVFYSIYVSLTYRPIYRSAVILLGLIVLSLLAFIASSVNIFRVNDSSEVFGMLLLNLGPQFIGLLLLYVLCHLKSDKAFLDLLFYSGLFITVVNLLIFVLLLSSSYELVANYMVVLGLDSYVFDLSSFFLRPSGYFFDLHSQYYLPVFSLVLLRFKKIQLSSRATIIYSILIILSLGVSGIKSAYLTLFVLLMYWFLVRLNNYKSYLYLILVTTILLVIDLATSNLASALLVRVWEHDILVLIEHFTEVPIVLYENYPITFLLGGQPLLANFIYSEVYYVQLIYYIGIIGLVVAYIIPIITLFFMSKDSYIKSLTIIFALSLLHYSVFKIGVNMIGTAFLFCYFYRIILNFRIKEWSR